MINSPRNKSATNGLPELDFDLTQEIDPLLADIARSRKEPTLSEIDLDDVEAALDVTLTRRAGRRA